MVIFHENFKKNRDFFQTHCNNCRNPFHFACRQCYQGILT